MKVYNLVKRVNGFLKKRAWKYWSDPRLRKTKARECFLDTRRVLNPGIHNSCGCLQKTYRMKAANISSWMGEGYMSFHS